MIVKCLLNYPNKEQIDRLGAGFVRDQSFNVVVGREYLVLGLTINATPEAMGDGPWVRIMMEQDIPTVIHVPLCLFVICDPRPSRYWELRMLEDWSITLWPRCFYRESFLENVSDRQEAALDDFWNTHALLDAESKEPLYAGASYTLRERF